MTATTQKHPILDRIEKLEKKRAKNKRREEIKEFVLLVAAIVFASFIYDGILALWKMI